MATYSQELKRALPYTTIDDAEKGEIVTTKNLSGQLKMSNWLLTLPEGAPMEH